MQHLRDTNSITDGRDEKLAKHNLFETPRFFADIYVLRPGQAQPVHAHAGEDKCYLVLDGEGVVISGEERHEVRGGQIVLCPAGADHGVENRPGAAGDLRLLVFMAPHPRPERLG